MLWYNFNNYANRQTIKQTDENRSTITLTVLHHTRQTMEINKFQHELYLIYFYCHKQYTHNKLQKIVYSC